MKLTPYRPHSAARRAAWTLFLLSLGLLLGLGALRLFAGLSPVGKVTVPLLVFAALLSALPLIQKRRVLLYSLCGVLLAANFVFFLVSNDGAEYHIASPRGAHTVIVRERSALVSSGWADLYQKQWGVFKRHLDVRVGTDDNYQPFAQGQYRVEWADETHLALEYYNGHGYQRIEIEL